MRAFTKIRGLLTIPEILTTILHKLISKIVKLKESTSTWVEFWIVLSFLYMKGLTRKLKSNLLTMLILMILGAFTLLLSSWWIASWLEWWEIVALGCCSHPSSACKFVDGFCSMCILQCCCSLHFSLLLVWSRIYELLWWWLCRSRVEIEKMHLCWKFLTH